MSGQPAHVYLESPDGTRTIVGGVTDVRPVDPKPHLDEEKVTAFLNAMYEVTTQVRKTRDAVIAVGMLFGKYPPASPVISSNRGTPVVIPVTKQRWMDS